YREPLCKLVFANKLGQLIRLDIDGWRNKKELRARCKGSKNIEDGEIKRERRMGRIAVGSRNIEIFHSPFDKLNNVGVRNYDSLGSTGGTGGKKYMCGILTLVSKTQRLRRIASCVCQSEFRLPPLASRSSIVVHPADRNFLR